MNWTEEERPEKAKARKLAYAFKRKNFNHALTLPSNNMVDAIVMYQRKLKVKHHTFVEKEHKTFLEMVKSYNLLVAHKIIPPDNAVFVKGELSSVLFDDDRPPIDLAIIDLCGNINLNLAYWIKNRLKPVLADKAQLSFTFTYNTRNAGDTHVKFAEIMQSHLPKKFNRNYRESLRIEPEQKYLEASYKTFFQSVFDKSKIGNPYAYGDTNWKMMLWKFKYNRSNDGVVEGNS